MYNDIESRDTKTLVAAQVEMKVDRLWHKQI